MKKRSPFKLIRLLAIYIIAAYAFFIGYAFLSSPAAVRAPAFQHFHLRMQVLVDGEAENFASKKYQKAALKDACAADLAAEPFHFHDKKDQMVHVHWDNMTGGTLLKYYGWNKVGGSAESLGYRFDQLPKLEAVPVHGQKLPAIPKDAKFYVYVGDENGYKERKASDFFFLDLEKFFGKQSNLPANEETSFMDKLFPKASAHAGHEHEETVQTISAPADKPDLEKLNNLIGNVVVFVQKDKPSADEVKARFDKLEPLGESTCAG